MLTVTEDLHLRRDTGEVLARLSASEALDLSETLIRRGVRYIMIEEMERGPQEIQGNA